ncbi:MAG: acetylxylan esterase [Armatimonadota bacterium]|nr:acetylxylan esterase [Armatimonadota bacterium]
MRAWIGVMVACVAALAATGAWAAETGYRLSVVTERPEAFYRVGETARFVVTLEQGGAPAAAGEVAYILDKDGVPPVTQGRAKVENGRAVIEGRLGEPGFLRCRVTFKPEEGDGLSAVAGAGFDPEQIGPSMPAPNDFDAFWSRQKARLAAVPFEPKLTPVSSPQEGVECFDVQIPCVPPRPVSGYFARPVGAAPKSLPAILTVHGAGVRSSSLGGAVSQARSYRALAMDINAHGIPNGQPESFYAALNAGELKDYRSLGRESAEECYFLGMFLRLVRALEFLTRQPEWDGKVLMVLGSSQGGGQAIAAAGLDPRVTFISAGVPALCDHTGSVVGRISGWPKLVPVVDGKPDEKILQVSRYFDCVNFARRARAEAIFSVGLIDSTCPPTSVYAAYNAYAGKKRIIVEPLMGHAVSPRLSQSTSEAMRAHIAATR